MKLSKKIFWISLLISIITIAISIYIEFFSEKNQHLVFVSNIVQNVFAGTSVLTITTLYEYWSLKKEIFDEIIEEANIIRDRFAKIQYYNEDIKVIEVQRGEKISNIFPKIKGEKSFDKDKNYLMLNEMILENEKLISDYDLINEESILISVIKSSTKIYHINKFLIISKKKNSIRINIIVLLIIMIID